MDQTALLNHRAERDRFFLEHYASPLPDEHREDFTGLDYYPPDPAWFVAGRYEATGRAVPIVSSTGTEIPYSSKGDFVFWLGGDEVRLVVLDDGDGGVFIPFGDRTNGDTTYPGGRYVSIEIGDDGSASVDFNRAGNPWCAYDSEFSCPLPPASNVLAVAVNAGEKVWTPRRGRGVAG